MIVVPRCDICGWPHFVHEPCLPIEQQFRKGKCRQCGEVLRGKRHHAKWCSDACKMKAARMRKRAGLVKERQ